MSARSIRFLVLCAFVVVPALAREGPSLRGKGVPVLRERFGQPPTDDDVQELLRDWPIFDDAMARLHASDVQPPQTKEKRGVRLAPRRTPLAPDADDAWIADRRVREAFARSGSTPERFVDVYRRVADAWWLLHERETREETEAALTRAIDALPEGAETGDVRAELQRGRDELREAAERPEPPGLDVIRRHRAALERVFSPAATP